MGKACSTYLASIFELVASGSEYIQGDDRVEILPTFDREAFLDNMKEIINHYDTFNNEYYYDLGEGENHGKIKKSNLLKACENPIYVNTIIMNIAWNIYHDSDMVYKIFYDYKGEDNFDYRSLALETVDCLFADLLTCEHYENRIEETKQATCGLIDYVASCYKSKSEGDHFVKEKTKEVNLDTIKGYLDSIISKNLYQDRTYRINIVGEDIGEDKLYDKEHLLELAKQEMIQRSLVDQISSELYEWEDSWLKQRYHQIKSGEGFLTMDDIHQFTFDTLNWMLNFEAMDQESTETKKNLSDLCKFLDENSIRNLENNDVYLKEGYDLNAARKFVKDALDSHNFHCDEFEPGVPFNKATLNEYCDDNALFEVVLNRLCYDMYLHADTDIARFKNAKVILPNQTWGVMRSIAFMLTEVSQWSSSLKDIQESMEAIFEFVEDNVTITDDYQYIEKTDDISYSDFKDLVKKLVEQVFIYKLYEEHNEKLEVYDYESGNKVDHEIIISETSLTNALDSMKGTELLREIANCMNNNDNPR